MVVYDKKKPVLCDSTFFIALGRLEGSVIVLIYRICLSLRSWSWEITNMVYLRAEEAFRMYFVCQPEFRQRFYIGAAVPNRCCFALWIDLELPRHFFQSVLTASAAGETAAELLPLPL